MQIIKLFLISLVILFTGCSTHTVHLKYTGNSEVQKGVTPSIGKIIIIDNRDKESNLLGSMRSVWGIKHKTLRTDNSINKLVENVYKEALTNAGLFNDKGNKLLIFKGEINKLYSYFKLKYETGVLINISLINSQTNKIIFRSPYRSEGDKWSIVVPWFLGVMFASVDTLRDLTEKALNSTVEKTIADPEFIKTLNYIRSETAEAEHLK